MYSEPQLVAAIKDAGYTNIIDLVELEREHGVSIDEEEFANYKVDTDVKAVIVAIVWEFNYRHLSILSLYL